MDTVSTRRVSPFRSVFDLQTIFMHSDSKYKGAEAHWQTSRVPRKLQRITIAAEQGVAVSVPIYSAAGRCLDRISDRVLARMESAGRFARVVRRRDGVPVRAYLLPRDGTETLGRISVYLGQRYSFQERLSNCRVWTHRRIGPGTFRQAFASVLKSCFGATDDKRDCDRLSDSNYSPTGSILNWSKNRNAAQAPHVGRATPKVSAGPS